ncbi:MAG: MOSC domain-containing protein [Woeseiaceae bacterium]
MSQLMRLVSINVGRSETLSQGNRRETTGICKYPREGSVNVTYGGISGDAIVDSKHHGGADQAVYAYSADDYDWWAETTDRDYFPGLFGENLTIRDMPSDMRIGDRLLIGAVVLEATAPRIPCATFSMRMEDKDWGIAFDRRDRTRFVPPQIPPERLSRRTQTLARSAHCSKDAGRDRSPARERGIGPPK